jgi:hypothetical protein
MARCFEVHVKYIWLRGPQCARPTRDMGTRSPLFLRGSPEPGGCVLHLAAWVGVWGFKVQYDRPGGSPDWRRACAHGTRVVRMVLLP